MVVVQPTCPVLPLVQLQQEGNMPNYKDTNEGYIIMLPDTKIAKSDFNQDYLDYLEWAKTNTPDPADPVTVPPLSCNAAQIRLALNKAKLRLSVDGAVLSSSDQDLKDKWQYSPVFKEDDPSIIAMATAIGVDSAGLHNLFQLAVTL
jgi:hypothetical protein